MEKKLSKTATDDKSVTEAAKPSSIIQPPKEKGFPKSAAKVTFKVPEISNVSSETKATTKTANPAIAKQTDDRKSKLKTISTKTPFPKPADTKTSKARASISQSRTRSSTTSSEAIPTVNTDVSNAQKARKTVKNTDPKSRTERIPAGAASAAKKSGTKRSTSKAKGLYVTSVLVRQPVGLYNSNSNETSVENVRKSPKPKQVNIQTADVSASAIKRQTSPESKKCNMPTANVPATMNEESINGNDVAQAEDNSENLRKRGGDGSKEKLATSSADENPTSDSAPEISVEPKPVPETNEPGTPRSSFSKTPSPVASDPSEASTASAQVPAPALSTDDTVAELIDAPLDDAGDADNAKEEEVEQLPLILYDDELSPQSRCVRMLLKILNLEPEIRFVDLSKGEQLNKEFMNISPMRIVPVLKHGERTLLGAPTILMYLADNFTSADYPNLLPQDSEQRLNIISRLFFDCSIPNRRQSELYTEIVRKGYSKADIFYHEKKVLETYEIMNTLLKDGNYVAGDDLTIADIALISTLGALDLMFHIEIYQDTWPHLYDWFTRMCALPAYSFNADGLRRQRQVIEQAGDFCFPQAGKHPPIQNCPPPCPPACPPAYQPPSSCRCLSKCGLSRPPSARGGACPSATRQPCRPRAFCRCAPAPLRPSASIIIADEEGCNWFYDYDVKQRCWKQRKGESK